MSIHLTQAELKSYIAAFAVMELEAVGRILTNLEGMSVDRQTLVYELRLFLDEHIDFLRKRFKARSPPEDL